MPSTPLICSSIGVATVSAITFGLAPGKGARTTTPGGTTSGYSEIGIAISEIRPARKIRIDSTPAKIGRSMKNFDRFIGIPPGESAWLAPCDLLNPVGGYLLRRTCAHLRDLGFDQRAGTDPLQSVDHDAVAGHKSRRDDPQTIDRTAKRDRTIGSAIVGPDHHHEFLVLKRWRCFGGTAMTALPSPS